MGSGFSFETVNALDYEELRSGYAPAAARWVAERGGLDPHALVVDLAAGTGQLTRAFDDLGLRVVAVEPASNMRSVLEARLPSVRTIEGSAEDIPIADAGADAVVVGNAFHHFDADATFPELRRVLRARGPLALFWARSAEDETTLDPILGEVDEAVGRARASSSIAHAYRSWVGTPRRIDGFTPFERRAFATIHAVSSERLADLLATSSDVASLPAEVRERLLERIAEFARALPDRLELRASSVVDLCFREEAPLSRSGPGA